MKFQNLLVQCVSRLFSRRDGQRSTDWLILSIPSLRGIILFFSPASSWTVYVGSHLQLKHSIRGLPSLSLSLSLSLCVCPSSLPGRTTFSEKGGGWKRVEGRENSLEESENANSLFETTAEVPAAISCSPSPTLLLSRLSLWRNPKVNIF